MGTIQIKKVERTVTTGKTGETRQKAKKTYGKIIYRGTWQLVAAEDYWMMIGLCAPKAIAVTKGWMSSNRIGNPIRLARSLVANNNFRAMP